MLWKTNWVGSWFTCMRCGACVGEGEVAVNDYEDMPTSWGSQMNRACASHSGRSKNLKVAGLNQPSHFRTLVESNQ